MRKTKKKQISWNGLINQKLGDKNMLKERKDVVFLVYNDGKKLKTNLRSGLLRQKKETAIFKLSVNRPSVMQMKGY